MFNLFKKDPVKQLNKEYQALLLEGMKYQRNGDIKRYSEISEKAEAIRLSIDELEKSKV